MKRIILLALCLIWIVPLTAQRLREFTPDRQAYPEELEQYFKDLRDKDKDALESLMLAFTGVWNSGAIDDAEAAAIYAISNNFLKKRMTAFEGWHDFLLTIVYFENEDDPDHLLPWLKDLQQLSAEKPARISQDYLHTMYLSLTDYIMYDDGRIRWRIDGGDFRFEYDEEPRFVFEYMDIWGIFKDDSTFIEGTSGVFYPKEYLLKASGGVVYFTRAGLSQDSAYVEMDQYELNVQKTDFKADSVTLNTLVFLSEPVMGYFEEKLTSRGGRDASFPRFISYRKDINIKNILPGADFTGGVSMIGSRFYGSGTREQKATLRFQYDGKEILRAAAERYLLRMDKIESPETELTVLLDEDSIYHPKVTLRYLPELEQLNIIRENEGLGQTPFSDSYHDLDMAFEILSWKVGEPQMQISNLNLGSESPVLFESKEYYRGQRFSALSGLDSQNPLYRIKNMSESYGTRDLDLSTIARYMRMSQQNAHIFMLQMSVLGFVEYDVDTREAHINDKVFDYIANFEKRRDYDVIRFVSNLSSGSNARLSLLNYDMEIDGVEAIALSDSQKVGLFPRNGKITVHENLNFDFDGRITAGRFSYWGEVFKFNYDQFRINMDNIDSMRFKVESFDKNPYGATPLVNVKTVLQELTGELLIDDPNNKSGREQYSDYPIFKCTKSSYIYYDRPSIFGGVYDRSEFYVELEPFEIDSLDNATTEGLFFEGTFTSAGIFPDLQQTLKVQEDYSLGFTTTTPPEGLSAYGKGTFTDTIRLSNQGLRGTGRIDYLNSYASSRDFIFFPDSTNGLASQYEISFQESGPETPHVVGNNVDLHWEPKNDVLYTTSKKASPFALYDDVGMRGTGTLAHSPGGLAGSGLMEFYNAETRSKDYYFRSRSFDSPNLAFRVRANPTADWGFSMDKAKGEVDFTRQKGEFQLIDSVDFFSFPANQYICYMDYAIWNIPEKSVDVRKTGANSSSLMVSVHPQQDSLQFKAGRTRFFLERTFLESFEVPTINVADASVFPDTGYVSIQRNANMDTLRNAAITASRSNRYHQFYGGVVDIQSRNSYTALADYEYEDKDGTPWPIRFENIRVDRDGTTIGRAQIRREEYFYMSPYFAFYGNVGLLASRKELEFNGYTHIESSCPSVSTDWFGFKSIIDPQKILIDLPEIDPQDKTKKLANGIYLNADTIGGYAAFLSTEVSPADKQMFFANGKLYYDEAIGSYVIASQERINNENAAGNYLAFNNTECTMYGEGSMSLGDGRSQMDIKSWGSITYNLNNDNMVMDMVLGLDFHFDDDIQKDLAAILNSKTSLEGADLSRRAFVATVNQVLEGKDKRKFLEDIRNYGAPEDIPRELQSTILITDVKIKWTPEAISFLNEGDIAIGGFGKQVVNKKMKAYLEIQRRRRGDEIYLFLEPDRRDFFYFEYKRNQLTLYTEDEEIMNTIKETELDKRRNEVKGKPPFVYTMGTKGRMNRFLRRIEEVE